MEKYYSQFETCRQHEKPYCTDECPFHLDVLDFQKKMESGRWNAAYKTYKTAVGFPEIAAELCPEYCAQVCPRKDIDDSVQLHLLEKACLSLATRKNPPDFNLPMKKGKIGIIGGGISGLSCALRLSSKKYQVTVFEKNDTIDSSLSISMKNDIERQFKFEEYTLKLNTEITNLESLNFDAIYIATGKNGSDFNINKTANMNGCAYFTGGALLGLDTIHSMAFGLDIAWSIEVFLKTKTLKSVQPQPLSKVATDISHVEIIQAVIPSNKDGFTEEEAKKEAARCIRCKCDACRVNCDLTTFTNKWPLKMRDEIISSTLSSGSLLHKTPAIRLINSCSQCGLCSETCPSHIQLDTMIKEARYSLHKQCKTPGAFHQFWLNDMNFSNSEYASLAKAPSSQGECKQAFFPGCYLGGANPEYVLAPYRQLLKENPNTGILLQCCSIPANWAGNEKMLNKELDQLRNNWISMGKPELITACSSCTKHLNEYLPEIPVVSLYEVLASKNCSGEKIIGTWSVFDPCSARHFKKTQESVRTLISNSDISTEEFHDGAKHGCCGFGGQGSIANPDFADYMGKQRSLLNKNPYIVYCINCKEVFLDQGKPVKHILDILYNIEDKKPTETERRKNKIILKETLLNEFFGEKMKNKPEENKYELLISQTMQEKMDKLKLLESDVCKVLEVGEELGRKTFNAEDNTYKCYGELGHITCWVEYKIKDDLYEIINLYTHRMKIKLEEMWNGKKAEINLP